MVNTFYFIERKVGDSEDETETVHGPIKDFKEAFYIFEQHKTLDPKPSDLMLTRVRWDKWDGREWE